ncbi:helix-turn-helix domain-containing protein [Pseudomonas guariconensis]|uniref:helix-turn-helix domain-containing protein n=1 Tax=Pseudomonas guariconensis TaxID=1288410 RepID=UPI0018A9044D|nr:helix-turn-helix transcriptional regulator [Pseudomonas guariconensis]MBF8723354.1 helix-turn-helix transcriptional regulator [Pseudomonas guariconensis]MBF8795320.1 helix-turn-helix transcriptional regulator [Pseudomonas monteilii]
MGIQVISRDGQPEYAVVPWEQYQALLKAAGQAPAEAPTNEPAVAAEAPALAALSELTHLRQAKGLAPEQLARSVGISPAYLAMIEAGERQPDAAILRSLAWHLGIAGWSEPS